MLKSWKVRIIFIVLVLIFSVTFTLGIAANPNFTIHDFFLGLSTEMIGLVIALVLVESYVAAKKDKRKKAKEAGKSGTAYFIMNISMNGDGESSRCDEYTEKVKPIVESYGGEYIVRSEAVAPFSGSDCPDRVIVIKFKSKQRLEECFASPEYKEIESLRSADVKTNAFIAEK